MKRLTDAEVIDLAQTDKEAVQFSSRFKVFMTDKSTREIHQENRTLRLWFHNFVQDQCLFDAQAMMRALFKSDEFPRDYFSFIKRLMEFLRMFNRIRKIELEIQTLEGNEMDTDHPSRYLWERWRELRLAHCYISVFDVRVSRNEVSVVTNLDVITVPVGSWLNSHSIPDDL